MPIKRNYLNAIIKHKFNFRLRSLPTKFQSTSERAVTISSFSYGANDSL